MNKAIIAEFMGRKFYAYKGNSSYNKEFSTYKECEEWIRDFLHDNSYAPEIGWKLGCGKYDSSWDWLYKPYKKFFSLTEFDTVTDGKYHNRNPHFVQRLDDLQNAWSSLDIKRAFEQLVISIEWYNAEQEARVSDTTKMSKE